MWKFLCYARGLTLICFYQYRKVTRTIDAYIVRYDLKYTYFCGTTILFRVEFAYLYNNRVVYNEMLMFSEILRWNFSNLINLMFELYLFLAVRKVYAKICISSSLSFPPLFSDSFFIIYTSPIQYIYRQCIPPLQQVPSYCSLLPESSREVTLHSVKYKQ